jgi:hypothetical protein
MGFDTKEYYKAISGESTEDSGVWHLIYNKQHSFVVSSDYDPLDPYVDKISLPPSASENNIINTFSDKLGQKLKNTVITDNGDGTEKIDLELEDRIITIIVDQSGSMTWNDNNNFRHDIATDLINKININYKGNVTYNLIEYGADIIDVLLFGVVGQGDFDPSEINNFNSMIKADENANYDGIRIIRNDDHYPNSIVDGELIYDGFFSKVKDDNLIEGSTYYYTVYTYDKNLKFSQGVRIKATPRERIIPRGSVAFRSFVNSQDVTEGVPFIGMGVNRDDYTVGIWHMDEGRGNNLYDFSDTNAVLQYNKEDPTWYDTRFVPAGDSGLFFDGIVDKASYIDTDGDFSILGVEGNNAFTVMAWICPYVINTTQYLFSISSSSERNVEVYINGNGNLVASLNGETTTSSAVLSNLQWQHIAITYSGDNPSSFEANIYINGVGENVALSGSGFVYSSIMSVIIANSNFENAPYRGKMTEVSFHKTERNSTYINSQLVSNSILNTDNDVVGTETIGIKEDNGDRLVVLKYDISDDYNFAGGEVTIVKNEKNIPSWEEDGDIIYQETARAGQFFVSDVDDFALGEKYYYRLFTKNSLGNVSFQTDSNYLIFNIPKSSTNDYFLSLISEIISPQSPIIGQLITPGNEKIYLRWTQLNPIDANISRTKIYYSPTGFPVVNSNGGFNGILVFTGLVTDEKFVHRNINNNANAYYTIVNVDKYGRASNYDENGVQVENFLNATSIPTSSSAENTFPLVEVENINYEIFDENAVSIGWKPPRKNNKIVDAFFDQTVFVYASITDEFGSFIPEDTPLKMNIVSAIERENQADDVFSNRHAVNFADIDAYEFFVTRTSEGLLKAVLKMTDNVSIISQIKTAVFEIQIQALIPKEGGYVPPNTEVLSSDPLSQYSSLITELAEGEESTQESADSDDNFFEYYSKTVIVSYTNPWEIELVNKDNKKVSQRCYCEKTDEITKEKTLHVSSQEFNGIYIRATAPFVARAKVKYKGEIIDSGTVQIAVWDADSSNLCQNACSDSDPPPDPYEGPKIEPSSTVLPLSNNIDVIQGTEETYEGSGEFVPISYVDIPLQAPNLPQAIRLFAKSSRAGYSSTKDMYILFQTILNMELQSETPAIDGKDIGEQIATISIIDPDNPNTQINEYDKSLTTYPEDLSIVQWELKTIDIAEGRASRSIYSIDNVPLSNGVFSYTRNGVARNVFFGPVPRENVTIDETYEIKASIIYEGLTAEAKQFIDLDDNPDTFDRWLARFLMEINGGWRGDLPNQTYGGKGWLGSDNPTNALWSDGINYKKLAISRNPRIASTDDFASADCFRECANEDGNEILELSSGQIVHILTGDDNIEILHGEIYERENEYTGVHYLEIGKEGFVSDKEAFIELNNEEDSDITYFYIRAKGYIPEYGKVANPECNETDFINDCLCLAITECDIPEWKPVVYISGNTTVFVNNQPLVLTGGGAMGNGIPPCPICLKEPLKTYTIFREVTNYFYSKTLGDPLNDYIYPVITEVGNNGFLDENGDSLIKHNSDVKIRVKVMWRGDSVPDGTPVYVSIGDNSGNTIFVASQNVYYTQTDSEDNASVDVVGEFSYVDVKITARKPVEVTTTENVEIFSTYDEAAKTDRRSSQNFSLTLDKKEDIVDLPPLPEEDPSTEEEVVITTTPFSSTMERYNIDANLWEKVLGMKEERGNTFSGSTGDYIYCIGGLKNNSLNISNKTERYNVVTNVWDNGSNMETARFAGMSITVGEDIYTIGGVFPNKDIDDNLSVSTKVEVYHTDLGVWETLSNMPIIDEGGAFEEELGVAFGTAQHIELFNGSDMKNYIYIIGGVQEVIVDINQFDIKKYNQRTLRYCIEDNEWEYSNVLRSNELSTYERISPLSLIYDNKIIVFGGAIESGNQFIYPAEDFYINITEKFVTPSSGEWVNFNSGFMGGFPVPKFQSGIIKHITNPSTDPTMYFILGGANENAPSLDLLERINIQNNVFNYESSYENVNDPSGNTFLKKLLIAKHGFSTEYSNLTGTSYIYVIGGYTINRDNSFVDISFDI